MLLGTTNIISQGLAALYGKADRCIEGWFAVTSLLSYILAKGETRKRDKKRQEIEMGVMETCGHEWRLTGD